MIYIIGVMISFILYILVGFFVSKKIKNLEDYYVAGRNAPTLLIVGSLVASYLSTVAFMGEAALSYDGYAIPLIIQSIFALLGYVFGVLIFGRYLRRSKVLTLPEYFGKRFNSRKLRMVTAITLIIGLVPYLVAVTQGAGIVLSELGGISYGTSLTIITFVFTVVTFLSGAKGVLVTDTIMFLLFTITSFLCIPFILIASGGWPEAFRKSSKLQGKPDLLSWHGITGDTAYLGSSIDVFFFAIIIGLVLGVIIAVSPWQTSRYLMAKNEHVAIRSGVIATIFISFFYLFLHPTITTINIVNPSIEPSEKAFIWGAMNLVPTWIGVITICGILAAALSSSSTFLQLIGNSVSKDLFVNSKVSDKRLLFFSRFVMLGVGLITLLITLFEPPAVYWMGVFAATLFAASWGPVAIASVFSKRITSEGAFWSIISGFSIVCLIQFFDYFGFISFPVFLDASVFGAVGAIIALVVGSKLTEPTPKEVEFRQNLLILPESEYNEMEIKVTKRYPLILIVSGVLLIIVTFIFYYLPLYIVPY